MAVAQDITIAVRQLRKAPAFALTAMFTLAAGIAATTIVFSIVDAVLLRPLPFPASDRLVAVSAMRSAPGSGANANLVEEDVSYPNFYDWRSQATSFEAMASYKVDGYTLSDPSGGPAQRVSGGIVSSDIFRTLGVSPLMGRGFRRDEEQAGNRSVVISYALWHSQFGGVSNVIGHTVRLNEEDYTVVGVMDRGFQFPVDATDTEFWVTQAHDAEGKNPSANQRGWSQLSVVGRLRQGASVSQAHAEMDAIQKRLAAQYPDDDKNQIASSVVPLASELVGDVGKPLHILFASVSFLLLIACANVAGLLLTRTNSRRSEMSVRAALGASRPQILRQVFIESLTLALGGGALGILISAIVLKAAPLFLPANLPRVHSVSLDAGVAMFAVALSLLTGLIFGALPAWRMSRVDPATALREGSRGTTAGRGQNRLQSALVVAETAIGLILLIGAGLLLRSFDRILHVDPGFRSDHLVTFRIAMPQKRYTADQRVAFFNRLMPQLEAIPGVKSATGAFPLPLSSGDIRLGFTVVGQKTAPGDEPAERLSLVQAKYFQTLGIQLRQGRFFAEADHRAIAPAVAIVNETFARKYFAGQSAIGQRIQTDVGVTDASPIREIVGVVGDVKRTNLTEDDRPEYYVPIEQGPLAPPTVAMRVAGDPLSYEKQIRAIVASDDSALPVYRIRSYQQELARITAQQRFEAILLTGFAAIALLLSAVGLYGVLSYMVSQRTKEIGLRIALGAQRGAVQAHFLRQGVTLGIAGLAIGSGIAVVLTRFMASLLFGISRFDLLTFASTSLLLFCVTCIASLMPAYRASRLDPIQALRTE